MILLCGIPSEPPMRLVRERLEALGIPVVEFNQRQFASAEIGFEVSGRHVSGELRLQGRAYPLEEFQGVFARLMDDRNLPEIMHEPVDSPRRRYCRSLHDTLMRWYELAPTRVVNRATPQGSNSSKPYQAQLIRMQGFLIPETLVTNDPQLVIDFFAQHKRVVYKSISGVRSIVREIEEKDFARLEHIRWCPTQFQAYVEGTNLRVHTVGDEVFATAISAKAIDYRYAMQQCDEPAALREVELADEVAEKCLNLSHVLGLPLAGIDLKITPENEIYCFEVNPCPAFSYYESSTGQPISEAIARYLVNGYSQDKAKSSA